MGSNQDLELAGMKILVVDDEEVVREVMTMIIREHGGDVVEAGDGNEAIDHARTNEDLTCAILDYSMPGLTGYDTFKHLEKVHPEIPVLMVSGLALEPEVAALEHVGRITFLSKPFGEFDLVRGILRTCARHTGRSSA